MHIKCTHRHTHTHIFTRTHVQHAQQIIQLNWSNRCSWQPSGCGLLFIEADADAAFFCSSSAAAAVCQPDSDVYDGRTSVPPHSSFLPTFPRDQAKSLWLWFKFASDPRARKKSKKSTSRRQKQKKSIESKTTSVINVE